MHVVLLHARAGARYLWSVWQGGKCTPLKRLALPKSETRLLAWDRHWLKRGNIRLCRGERQVTESQILEMQMDFLCAVPESHSSRLDVRARSKTTLPVKNILQLPQGLAYPPFWSRRWQRSCSFHGKPGELGTSIIWQTLGPFSGLQRRAEQLYSDRHWWRRGRTQRCNVQNHTSSKAFQSQNQAQIGKPVQRPLIGIKIFLWKWGMEQKTNERERIDTQRRMSKAKGNRSE